MRAFCVLSAVICLAADTPPKVSPVMEAMKQELARSMAEFKNQPTPPYFLSYEMTGTENIRVAANFGALTSSTATRQRLLDIDLRVGGYDLDNTRPIRGTMFNILDTGTTISMPLEDDREALRALLWYHTDQKYKRAIEQLIAVRTNVKVKVENTDKSGDFSAAPAETYIETQPPALKVDRAAWERKVREYTEPFRRFGNLYQATATLSGSLETRRFLSSDGAMIETFEPRYRLQISSFGKADDGMELPRYETFYSSTLGGLPDDATVFKAVEKMLAELRALKLAPVMEPYVGPAILSGRAAAVFFHEVFLHRVEAQRQKNESDGQTFRDKVGQPVLPDFISIYADPTQRKLGRTELSGAYRFDNQGVKARRVDIVEKGILKNFLMSRAPVDNFPSSNGHGRKQPGRNTSARQSNIVVSSSKMLTPDELKQHLLAEVKQAKLPYGLYFEDIAGGFTSTGRGTPNSFNVTPLVVYRIYPDGREELVRGVDLIGTPLTSFTKLLAAGGEQTVFNGTCGAESGMIPVAVAAPPVLLAQVEVQKKPKSQERSPILPPPFDDKP